MSIPVDFQINCCCAGPPPNPATLQVMIVSYETFRIHAERFKAEGTCDLLICDEVGRTAETRTSWLRVEGTPAVAPDRASQRAHAGGSAAARSPPLQAIIVSLPSRGCPQAHRLKNDATLTNRALDSLACRRRVLLSGTPLQNRLDEFYGGLAWLYC